MAWGETREFIEGENRVRAIPSVDDPITSESKIDRVVITHMDGDRKTVERMAENIKKTYTGALYSTWKPL